jgi:hypothetical protein
MLGRKRIVAFAKPAREFLTVAPVIWRGNGQLHCIFSLFPPSYNTLIGWIIKHIAWFSSPFDCFDMLPETRHIAAISLLEGNNMHLRRHEYENQLRSLGCQPIGKGLYSNVFSIPDTDKVVKVADMDRWPEYIHWATKNGYAGKFAPKVYSLKFKGDYYVAIMERLACTIGETRLNYDEGHAKSSQYALYQHITSYRLDEPCEATELVEFVLELRKERLVSDLHDGNAMIRHDGQIVVTDPCAGRFGSEQFRIKSGELA